MAIRPLAPEVADAIAAGEVVERPASVVKELVENALDAGARRVAIEIAGAGRTLIRVADDGAGIAAGELELAFRRHATSKLATVAELSSIATLGFRGEALASVAAVADVEARSCGRRLRVRAGALIEEGSAPSQPGTVVEVRDLFAAVPARLRFLKSDAAENAAVVKVVTAHALSRPEVSFRLLVDGRAALASSGDGDQVRVAGEVWGRTVAVELLVVKARPGQAGEVGVGGLVSQMRISRGGRDGILLSVNRRPIASRSLTYAVEDAYRGSLEKGRYPIAVLDLELDPTAIDVNVHPTKREVRFHQEGAVFAALQRAVRSGLGASEPYRFTVARPTPGSATPARLPGLSEPTLHRAGGEWATAPAPPPTGLGPLRGVGQVQAGYLVAEGADGLVLVDQHAAHERILYNRFLGRLAAPTASSQPLLLAQTVDLDPAQMAAWADGTAHLGALGFEIEEFGPRVVRVLAAPAETPLARVADALAGILTALAEGRSGDALERAAASLACHSAVRFGDPLEPAEQRRLLDELEGANASVTCPHGRPTRLIIEWGDLRRHFRRNY